MSKSSIAEFITTVLLLVFVGAVLLGGLQLTGFVNLSHKIIRYVGGAMLAYLVVIGFIIIHNSVKFMSKKGE